MKIYCCGCEAHVNARLTDGKEIYPHRKDLYKLPFWKCDECNNFVGCHHKTNDRTAPLGCIPTKEIRSVRSLVHSELDPLWKGGKYTRKQLYAILNQKTGMEGGYHTAKIRSVDDGMKIYQLLKSL